MTMTLLTSNHRGHGQAIAKGIDLNGMMAEILVSIRVLCKGEGWSMHIVDPDAGNLGANGSLVVVWNCSRCCLQQMKRPVKLSSASLGTAQPTKVSSTKQSIWFKFGTLPVIFYCINNGYGISADIKK